MTDSLESLLATRICDLGLSVAGTQLEELVQRLHTDLREAGLLFMPDVYLTDGWGCPDGVPVIGMPFYLADPRLSELQQNLTEVPAEQGEEAMMVLRHEAGHAYNYAYRLYETDEWIEIFGDFSLPYRGKYRIKPFSARYVRHVAGWYVQRHFDDDFAETFAVWLIPGSRWDDDYRRTHALSKLSYVDRVACTLGGSSPIMNGGELDMPLSQMTMTVGTWFRSQRKRTRIVLSPIIDNDLKRLFPGPDGLPAGDILTERRLELIRSVHFWTGIDRRILSGMIDSIVDRVGRLRLRVETDRITERIAQTYAFVTTLAMNYVNTGRFLES